MESAKKNFSRLRNISTNWLPKNDVYLSIYFKKNLDILNMEQTRCIKSVNELIVVAIHVSNEALIFQLT